MTAPHRCRFAPSPTGNLHIGGARTALFNWAFARRNGGVFVLRIEDTDRARSTPEFERAILEGLRWLGIDWDEGPDVGGPYGPYRQSERADAYERRATALLESGAAYRCFCTSERLDALRAEQQLRKETPAYDRLCAGLSRAEGERRSAAGEPSVVRFRVPEGETRFSDAIRGDVVFRNSEVDDWIMVRSDGAPTYNFVVVCDDVDMRITHVLRGEEHLTNTPKQVLLYRAFEEPLPGFAHFPLMLGSDKKKLSKRTGDTALQDYRDNGYPPEAVLNFLCLQGWALDGTTEVFSIEELERNFDVKDVSKGGAVFDPEKFLWMAGEYVRKTDVDTLAERCLPFVVRAGLATQEELTQRRDWFRAVVASEQERIRIYSDLPERIAYLFAADDAVDYQEKALKNARKNADAPDVLARYGEWLAPRIRSGVKADELRAATKAWVEEQGLSMPALFQPLRCALTGFPGGPDLFETMALLGAQSTIARIEAGVRRLREA